MKTKPVKEVFCLNPHIWTPTGVGYMCGCGRIYYDIDSITQHLINIHGFKVVGG